MVVADDRYLAEDAVGLIEVDWEPLPAVDRLPSGRWPRGRRWCTTTCRTTSPRASCSPSAIQTRPSSEAAHVFAGAPRSSSAPAAARSRRAASSPCTIARQRQLTRVGRRPRRRSRSRTAWRACSGCPSSRSRSIAPDVGGGFGTKIMMFFPEEVLVPWAAMQLGRPVKWTEDRREHFIAANQERGQIHDVERRRRRRRPHPRPPRPLHPRHRRLHAVRHGRADHHRHPAARALQSAELPVRVHGRLHQHARASARTAAPAGRTRCFVMERLIDRIARELSSSPNEVRRRNFVQPDELPWDVGLPFQDGGARRATTAATTRPGSPWRRADDRPRRVSRSSRPSARRRGPLSGHRLRGLRRGHRHRAVRGRACAHRAERPGVRAPRA